MKSHVDTLHRRHEFADAVVDSEQWFAAADDLLFSARCLEPEIDKYCRVMQTRELKRKTRPLLVFTYEPDPRGSYWMLVAYAIENLCKGLLVVRDKDSFRTAAESDDNGKALRKALRGHKIVDLLQAVDFPFAHGDKDLAALLWRESVWAGRYPVPLRFDHDTLALLTTPDIEALFSWQSEGGFQVVKDFVSRVDSFVGSELERE